MPTIYTADEDRVINEVKRMLLQEFRQMLLNPAPIVTNNNNNNNRNAVRRQEASDLIRFSHSMSSPESPAGLNFTSSTNGHAVTPAGPAKETNPTESSISKVLNTETFPETLEPEPVPEIKFTPLEPGQWVQHLRSIRPVVAPGDTFEGWMAHFVSINEFYIHNEPETNASLCFAVNQMANQMKKLNYSLPNNQFSIHCLVAAKWTDYAWYRAWITDIKSKDEAQVFFIDYGNSCLVKRCDMLPLDDELRKYTVQAVKCKLHEYEDGVETHKFIPFLLENVMKNAKKLKFDVRGKRELKLFGLFHVYDVKITYTDSDDEELDAFRACLKDSKILYESESGIAKYWSSADPCFPQIKKD